MFLKKSKIFFIVIVLIVLSFNSCAFLRNLINRERELAIQRRETFTVDLRSPNVPVGQIDAQFNNLFPVPGIRTLNITVLYYPFEDAVCLRYRLNTYTYHQFWHKDARDAFVTALQQYNEDFEGRRLRNQNRRTKYKYGVAEECYLYWQQAQISITTLAEGHVNLELGYYFRDGSPFFSVTQMEAYFTSPTHYREDDLASPEIPIFFTRSQASDLAAFFDQDLLSGLAPDMHRPTPELIREITADEY